MATTEIYHVFTKSIVGFRVCSYKGWLEVLGAGMINPRVLEFVKIDPKEYTGFAFGMGIDRICMLKHGFDKSNPYIVGAQFIAPENNGEFYAENIQNICSIFIRYAMYGRLQHRRGDNIDDLLSCAVRGV